MAESLFRFCVIRPPAVPDPRYPAIDLGQSSAFQAGLGKDVQANPTDPRSALENASSTYISSTTFAPVSPTDANNAKLDALAKAISGLIGAKAAPTHASLVQPIQQALGTTATSPLPDWMTSLETQLKDSILALRLLGIEQQTGTLSAFSLRLQTIEVVRKASTDANFPLDATDLSKYSTRTIVVPDFAELKSIYSTAVARGAAAAAAERIWEADQARLAALWKLRSRLVAGKAEIVKLPPIHRTVIAATPFKPVPSTIDLTPLTIANQHLQLINNLTSLTLQSFKKDMGLPTTPPFRLASTTPLSTPLTPLAATLLPTPEVVESAPASTAAATPPAATTAAASVNAVATPTAANVSAITTPLINMSQALMSSLNTIAPQAKPAPALNPGTQKRYALLPSAVSQLSADATALFKDLNHDITAHPVDGTVKTLNNQLLSNAKDLDGIYANYIPKIAKIQNIGNSTLQYFHPATSIWGLAFKNNEPDPPRLLPGDKLLPKVRVGQMTILGIADLLVVKQQLVGYEGGDVAFIENVLKGETKTRELDTLTSTTVQQTTETTATTEHSTEVTTADRFEMSNESSNAIKDDESKKAGVTVSASYGPTVSVSANASISQDQSSSSSTKEASKYSKDITTKATDKITQSITNRLVTTTVSQTNTKETHSQSNTGNTQISGVYQWLNKVYEAQTWNYGKRTMLDFLIPEPGAFFLDKQSDPSGDNSTVAVIPPFTSLPVDIDLETYAELGAQYGVTNLDPPPQEMSRATAAYSAGKDEPMSKADTISIPQGFQVTGISITATGVADLGQNQNWVIVTCGEFQWGWDPSKEVIGTVTTTTDYWLWSDSSTSDIIGQGTLSGVGSASASSIQGDQTGIPWSVSAAYMVNFTTTIELFLERTDEAFKIWQNKTWSQIAAAAQGMIKDQKDALDKANYDAQFNSAFQGRNPDENQIIMRNEFKKTCISIMTDSHYDDVGAIQTSLTRALPGNLPISEIDLDKAAAHGPFVRFFEQAFEWEEMTWILYPYFWGRKEHWYRRVDYQDSDPEFEKFIQSGFARANLPVRPGFEGALEHYLSTGKIWDGGPLPGISSPTFLPIATEIQESLGKTSDDVVPYGDPWKVTVPTTLLRLRHDDQAPVWTKDPTTGTWTEQPDLGP
jgi:hypothetical protein